MTSSSLDLHQTSISSRRFVVSSIDSFESARTISFPSVDLRFESSSKSSIEALHKLLKRLAGIELPGKEHVEAYLRYVCRRNRRPNTLRGLWNGIVLFLGMIKDNGKTCIEEITRRDVEGFIEHEQDRGIKITTIKTKLACVRAFLSYLVEEGIILPDVLGRRIRLQLPDRLPRAMDPDDLRKLLSIIDHPRDRAMVLVLLRTGMRIGELLDTKVMDVNLKERRIEIYEAEKTRLGRVVYLSEDAAAALRDWFELRDGRNEFLLYCRGRSGSMHYSTARGKFAGYLVKAGLTHKGYTVHTLRHTFATELLNAGMRLECLQVLLGHQCIEETRRYARLTDKTREEEYFKAMSRIERGKSNDFNQCDYQLETILKEAELLAQRD
ncbi:MAG: tyrosine-type recombinase/integrase [Proteobacteria bacterium]|nr:tyrosine-type recombinase/integrase [Pseudomonadota bacterium]